MGTLQTDILLNGYKILQDKECFMFGIDSVLLADFAAGGIKSKDKVMDLCTGNGIIPLLLANHSGKITAIEIQERCASMAAKSVEMNALGEKIEIVKGDLRQISCNFDRHFFKVVTCNPPYLSYETGKQSPYDEKAIARHEVMCTLEDVLIAADYLLATHGKFFMIHKAFRLAEIMYLMKNHGIEPKRMRLIYPFEKTEPNLVLIEGRKNANPRLLIEKPLVVYNKPGIYTDEVQEIYARSGK